jgi:hypothetical protein
VGHLYWEHNPLIETTFDDVLQQTGASESIHSAAGRHADYSSILTALAYADLFDYPLSLDEVTRFQAVSSFNRDEIAARLADLRDEGRITSRGGQFCVAGREQVFETRRDRELRSSEVWERTRRYIGLLKQVPFVRMLAVTGALAVNNISDTPDIDLLVLAKPGRVWICRRFLVMLVRYARLRGDELCPNYILSTAEMSLSQRDFFTAHELAQMVPVFGKTLYFAMLRANDWTLEYLPRAYDHIPLAHDSVHSKRMRARQPRPRGLVEAFLGLAPFDRWERWEMLRLRRKLRSAVGEAPEVSCTPHQCKGHTGLHRRSILARFAQRLADLGLKTPTSYV